MPADDRGLVYESGDCEIDLGRRELRRRGSAVSLGSRAFDVVEMLVRAGGRLVTKDQLMSGVWAGAVVEDNTLQVHISAVRKVLGPLGAALRTESGRGYRLVGDWSAREGAVVHAPVNPSAEPAVNWRPSEAVKSNLPLAAGSLVGRSPAAQRTRALLSAYRATTLTGPGGIGKTVLALEVARDLLATFDHGAWLVDLAPLSDGALVPSAVAAVLGPGLSGDAISAEAVARRIADKAILLILDSCEHVINGVATMTETILRGCPRATVLATSREALRIDGEFVYRVPPLDVPASDQEGLDDLLSHSAVELFVARATALDGSFAPEGDSLRAIGSICRHLDGIPLAIEFAASRAVTLGVQYVAQGLGDRFALLTGGRRTALPRHQTLRAALDWSYDLLTEAEQHLLRRLAVFAGGFTLEAATAIARDTSLADEAPGETIANLVAKSLVAFDIAAGSSRWRLLETIRAYAYGKLVANGELDAAAGRHAAYFRDIFVPALSDFGLRIRGADIALYGRELDNVRAALDWCCSSSGDLQTGIELTAAYAPVWLNLSLVAECRERCEHALRSLVGILQSDARLRMRLQIGLGSALLHTLGPSQEAESVLTDALAAADALGDQDAQARALSVLSGVYAFRGDYARSLATAERTRQLAHQIGDPYATAVADARMGVRLMTLGRLSEARHSLSRATQSLLLREEDRGPLWRRSVDHALARASLARVLWLQGFAELAHQEARLSCDEAEGAASQVTICRVLYYGIGRIAPMTGDFAAAEDAIARLIGLATSLNTPFWATAGQFLRGKLLVERGEFADGLAQLHEAFGICEQTGWRLSYPEFTGSLALALAGLGRLGEAADAVSRAIAGAGGHEDGQQWYVPELLRIKAEILLRQSADHSGPAEECLEQAAAMAREQGALTWELRIALSLARLRVVQDRHDEAGQVLAPVHDRFTEGFHTTDLKAATDLLDAIPRAGSR